jgi:hypothetical protein
MARELLSEQRAAVSYPYSNMCPWLIVQDMTYVRQLKDYEDAVMAKRLEEMTDEEVQKMVESADSQKPPPQPQQRS